MQWTDNVTIETPEQIDVALEIAGVGSRFVAQLIDWLLKWLIIFVLFLLAVIPLQLLNADWSIQTLKSVLGAMLVLCVYCILLGFDIYYEVRHNGQTPGKKFAGIRVLREGGAPLDFRSACIRNLLGLADFLPMFYIFGAFLIMLNKRGQRLGDMAAGTIVVRERALAPPIEMDKMIAELATEEFAFNSEHLGSCTPDDRNILRSFFLRYREMQRHARVRLLRTLLHTFLDRTKYQAAVPIADSQRAAAFLASLYRDLQAYASHGQ